MVVAVGPAPDVQRLEVQAFSLLEVPFLEVQDGQAVVALGDLGIAGTKHLDANAAGPFVQGLGFVVTPLPTIDTGQFVQVEGQLKTVLDVVPVHHVQGLLEHLFRFRILGLIDEQVGQISQAAGQNDLVDSRRAALDFQGGFELGARFLVQPQILIDLADGVHEPGLGQRLGGKIRLDPPGASIQDFPRRDGVAAGLVGIGDFK